MGVGRRRHGDNMATLEQQQHAGWRNTYIEHGRHVRHARRAGRDQIGLVGGAYERQQTSPVAFGVRDAVDDASVPHGGRWAEHGDTIGRPIKPGLHHDGYR